MDLNGLEFSNLILGHYELNYNILEEKHPSVCFKGFGPPLTKGIHETFAYFPTKYYEWLIVLC